MKLRDVMGDEPFYALHDGKSIVYVWKPYLTEDEARARMPEVCDRAGIPLEQALLVKCTILDDHKDLLP